MLVALGFLSASLLGLLFASALWSRAVRLTTQRIKQSMPVTEAEIRADRDRLRAEFAVKLHRLETEREQAKIQHARQLIEINRRDANISALETDLARLKAQLEEHQNARRVLEQTVSERLPRVEARLAEAKRLLFNRDREIAELTQDAKKQKLALEEATSINSQQASQIERLNTALATRGARNRHSTSDARYEGEVALRSEIEALRAKTREQANLIDRLQRRAGHPFALPPPDSKGAGEASQQALSEAEAALSTIQAVAAASEAGRSEQNRQLRALTAKVEDQAGEIARLRAALAALEHQSGKASGSLKDSKLALKARLASAEAQAEQQLQTIRKLRAELAAAHERLAQQAAIFMEEMRRLGAGTVATSGQARRRSRQGDRRSLAERVARTRPPPAASADGAAKTGDVRVASVQTKDAPAAAAVANGHDRNGSTDAPAGESDKTVIPLVRAETPTAAPIGGQRRRPRLLERITGLGKN
jgi:hypothetical protein